MVGRRRRTSDSTTGTLDPEGQVYADELTVLKKFSQELDNEDSMLQTFALEDAIVCDKSGRPVELFSVKTKGPFTVRGRVVIGNDQKSRAKKPNTKTALIETKQCLRYAIGLTTEDNPAVWASGMAGWYELRPPAAEYKAIHDRMAEGISVYYSMMLTMETEREENEKQSKKAQKKRGKKHAEELSIENLLLKYAVVTGDGATYDEVVARCDEHAPFLISHFYEDTDEFDWTPTIFFKWLVERHPDIHTNVLESRKKKLAGIATTISEELPEETEAIAAPVATDEPPAQKTLARRTRRGVPQDTEAASHEVDTHDFATSQRSVRSRSRGKTKTQSRSPPPASPAVADPPVEPMDVDEAPASPPPETQRSNVDLILEGIEEMRPELEPLNKTPFSKVSSKLYYKHRIKEYYAAAEILKYHAKELISRLQEDEWNGSGFWKTLQEVASGPRTSLDHITLEQIPAQLVRRKAMTTTTKNTQQKAQGDLNKTVVIATPPPKRVGRPAGKRSALRLVGSIGSKRRFDGAETPDTVSRGSKLMKISHSNDSDGEATDNASSSGDDESESGSIESPAALKLVVRANNIPTTDPKGPNGTWVCDEGDCDFVVRNPDQDDGREKIQEHIDEAHYPVDENRDTLIDLAVAEGVKNHLPIDNLLEKIRRMGQKVQAKEEIQLDDGPLPPPIKRRLIS